MSIEKLYAKILVGESNETDLESILLFQKVKRWVMKQEFPH